MILATIILLSLVAGIALLLRSILKHKQFRDEEVDRIYDEAYRQRREEEESYQRMLNKLEEEEEDER